MNAFLIAFRYARALYDFSKENGEEETVLHELKQIRGQLLEVPELLPALQSPLVEASVKAKLMRMAVGTTPSTSLERFFLLLGNHQRENSLLDICRAYKRVYDKKKGITMVQVTTAIPLDEQQQDAFRNKLEASSGKKMEVRFLTNPDLIGGYVLTTDEKRLDTSVRSQLQTIQKKLTI
jgi:F-type H+-transporting ATPase subunit delta